MAGASVIQKTAKMMREMIGLMDQGAEKIRMLQESLLIEDRFTQIIIKQMDDNITQANKIRSATNEQQIAVATSFKTIEEVIHILDGMTKEVKSMAKNSDEILDNADYLKAATKQIEGDEDISKITEEYA